LRDVELVIFDCDGTLVDSEVLSAAALADALTEHGLPTSAVDARREYEGMLLGEIDARARAKLGRPLPEGWLEHFERDRAERFRSELEPIAGAAEAVQRIQAAGVLACVASQGKLEKTQLTLELTGLRPLFGQAQLFSAWSVPRGKPHPDLFLHAADAMGVAVAGCVVVEDSRSGVAAAAAAQMRAIGYAPDGDGVALREAGAGEIIGSLQQLPTLLGLG
jgi:HAD superfamily hydrolase (TIGR01509 family)